MAISAISITKEHTYTSRFTDIFMRLSYWRDAAKISIEVFILLVESFAQNFIYAVSCGSQFPKKHILLPSVLKALTGNS